MARAAHFLAAAALLARGASARVGAHRHNGDLAGVDLRAVGLPTWTPTYNAKASTIFMPCNYSGFFDARFAASFGVSDFDCELVPHGRGRRARAHRRKKAVDARRAHARSVARLTHTRRAHERAAPRGEHKCGARTRAARRDAAWREHCCVTERVARSSAAAPVSQNGVADALPARPRARACPRHPPRPLAPPRAGSNSKAHWANEAPMTCEEDLVAQASAINAVNPDAKVFV
jgi:hypothetical protein